MNQILCTKIIKSKSKKIYYFIIFFFSLLVILFLVILLIKIHVKKYKESKLADNFSNNYSIFYLYKKNNSINIFKDSDILGYITIPKISLNYPFFAGYSEDLLKYSPCKFFGNMPNKPGNLCITGHNYNDNRFFGRINELLKNDLIVIEDNKQRKYYYHVFDKYEVDANDVSPLDYIEKDSYILTLITCNNYNKKRIIIKAEQ